MASFREQFFRARLAGTAGQMSATDIFLARNPQFRPLDGDYTRQDYATGQEGATAEELFSPRAGMQMEVDGGWGQAPGTPPAIAALLRACGMGQTIVANTSVTYAPQGSGETFDALEAQMNIGGSVQNLGETRGSLGFNARSGQRPFFTFNFLGRYGIPQAVSWGAPDFSGWKYAPTANPTSIQALTVGGVTLCATEFSWTDGRTPMVDKYMNCPGVDITRRNITGRMVVEMPDIATKAIIDEARRGVTGAVLWEINAEASGDGAMRIAAPKVQVKFAGLVDIEGDLGANLDLIFLPDQGGDDLSIIFKAQE